MECLPLSRDDVATLTHHFDVITRQVPLHPIVDDAQYEVAIAAMNGLIDAGAGDEGHALAPLLGLLGEVIAAYEDATSPPPDAAPAEVLRLLMEQHGLKQGDLPEIGSQGVVSELLSGKRELNKHQIARLSERFGVSPATFF
ncbi:transcriptional regulator [Methylobacterium indicum]|uniref:helix-turn-helix domain-containing protein n=1 Tax=Methylobacterium indicum TaxID=1775910 RepID=UPI00073463CA|nr:transcriptional regulator [Methylobacterium indicum]KTS19467.1 transcriptional regulator [Methylobacterium indicum]KTS37947.1 transcriptional regulator [Methylobacterium indicum]KTS46970.1 transcriptional regulator [Methylobacterium indicum]